MNRIAKYLVTALLFGSLVAHSMAAPPLDSGFMGTYDGTGRACYGTVRLTAKTFSWRSPFQSVRNAPYDVVEEKTDNKSKILTIKLRKYSCKWQLPIIYLEHNAEEHELAWSIVGFTSMEDFKKMDTGNTLMCPLVKRPE